MSHWHLGTFFFASLPLLLRIRSSISVPNLGSFDRTNRDRAANAQKLVPGRQGLIFFLNDMKKLFFWATSEATSFGQKVPNASGRSWKFPTIGIFVFLHFFKLFQLQKCEWIFFVKKINLISTKLKKILTCNRFLRRSRQSRYGF